MVVVILSILILIFKKKRVSVLFMRLMPKLSKVSYKTTRLLKQICLEGEFKQQRDAYIENRIIYGLYGLSFITSLISTITENTWFIIVAITIFIFLVPVLKIKEASKKVNRIIENTLPTLLMQIVLIKGAGMSTLNAILKACDSKEDTLKRALYTATYSCQSGEPIERVFMDLSNKCQNTYITRFIRIIISDAKNGTKETIVLLSELNEDLWKYKKTTALKRGEEASTKLLLPMAIALISIIIAITVPAMFELFTF